MMHLTVLAVEGILLSLLKRDLRLWQEVYAPALAHVFRQRDALCAHRRAAQRTRQIGLRAYLRGFVGFPRKLAFLRRHGLPDLK